MPEDRPYGRRREKDTVVFNPGYKADQRAVNEDLGSEDDGRTIVIPNPVTSRLPPRRTEARPAYQQSQFELVSGGRVVRRENPASQAYPKPPKKQEPKPHTPSLEEQGIEVEEFRSIDDFLRNADVSGQKGKIKPE